MIVNDQLKNKDFKFYLCRKNSKLPLEKKYNTINNYSWFNEKIINHTGNLGLLTGGESKLVILDFDDESYYQSVKKNLPFTFTVITANKKMPHLYYYLKGEPFKYFGIDNYCDNQGVITNPNRLTAIKNIKKSKTSCEFQKWIRKNGISVKRVCDVMNEGGKVIIPGSNINKNYYRVLTDKKIKIKTITKTQLMNCLNITNEQFNKKTRVNKINITLQPKKIIETINLLEGLGLKRSNTKHFNCIRHDSQGGQCLYVNDDASIFCFHEQRYWSNIQNYIEECKRDGFIK